MSLTNITGISLPLAVWLAADDYDFVPNGKSISATSLLKPVRQILLRERMTKDDVEDADISDRIAARVGHAFHDSIEKAWKQDYRVALKALGHPDHIIDRIMINPSDLDLQIAQRQGKEPLPVYLEQRGSREIMGYKISGKFDQCIMGELNDTKSTSTFKWTKGSGDEDYCLQGSIYRWIHQDKITSDYIAINFIFTDWQRFQAKQNPNYPQQRVITHRVQLMSIEDTEAWIKNKLRSLEAAADLPEHLLPRCTDKELWRSDPVWKYFADPVKANQPGARSSKNFDNLTEAQAYRAAKGKGVVLEVPGQVKACGYCPAFTMCSQKEEYDLS